MNDNLILIVSNALTGIATYLVSKRQKQAELENSVLRNVELAVNIYKNLIDDLKQEIHSLNLKIQDLEKKVDDLMVENKKLKTEYTTGIKRKTKTDGTKLD
jgi:prefoldin subunit 5